MCEFSFWLTISPFKPNKNKGGAPANVDANRQWKNDFKGYEKRIKELSEKAKREFQEKYSHLKFPSASDKKKKEEEDDFEDLDNISSEEDDDDDEDDDWSNSLI